MWQDVLIVMQWSCYHVMLLLQCDTIDKVRSCFNGQMNSYPYFLWIKGERMFFLIEWENRKKISFCIENLCQSGLFQERFKTFRFVLQPKKRRHDIQHNDTWHNDIQHNDTQHKGLLATLTAWNTLSIPAFVSSDIMLNVIGRMSFCRMPFCCISFCCISFCWMS